jgi:hypothetical protein
MSNQAIVEVLKRIMKKAIVENAPAPAAPGIKENPDVKEPPTKAPGKPKPRRPLGNPDVKPAPKAKATMKEAEMLDKIVKRFRTTKKNG